MPTLPTHERLLPIPFCEDGKVYVRMPDNSIRPVPDLLAKTLAAQWLDVVGSAFMQRSK